MQSSAEQTPAAKNVAPGDEQGQTQSRDVTQQLVKIFGDPDQTSIRMQGSVFHPEVGKFSGVKDEDTRAKLLAAGLLLEDGDVSN